MVSATTFQIVMWTLSVVAALFLASRFAIRVSKKGRLLLKDYSLILAIPMLFVALGLLQTILSAVYKLESPVPDASVQSDFRSSGSTSRLVAVIEMLWIVIYCVKFCFLVQFKLYRPPYSYINAHLTKYYWIILAIYTAALVFTIIVPAMLCPSPDHCRYVEQSGNFSWEVGVTTLDIITDLLVVLLPIFFIRLANTPLLHAIIDGVFKTLSIFAIVVAAIRLALQYDASSRQINYIAVIYLLIVEAVVALIVASITSYRNMFLDYLRKTGRMHQLHLSDALEVQRGWRMTGLDQSSRTTQLNNDDSLVEVPILKPASPVHPPPH